ncbi:hypothetical protein DB313_04945 (plasmid) [Borrelia turcica IST7]|uniref:Uncharacterized protein n=1 Tax=Borrelia turcica IST7 TaxID=1104446 RepID=A0A386PNJ9_9SPIR|nr:hypothetical protein [Borrelia turcica]AYE36848.1 hypothetical protein DB313_04945 [Borrelia turcica IST7]
MRLYRVLLALLVMLMGCSQQASKEKDEEKPRITKTGKKKRKQKGVKHKKLYEKPVDDEINDNDDGEEEEINDNDTGKEAEISNNNTGKEAEIRDNNTGKEANSGDGGRVEETLYSVLEKKVNKLRGKLERAKNKFNETERPFPNKEERSRLFSSIQESKRATRAFLAEQYSFLNIVKLMVQQGSDRYPDRMDDIYAGLEYNAGLLAGLDKMITKLNHESQDNGPSSFYHLFLFRIGEVGEFNRKVLYEYFSDATLAKLKRGSDADIEKANELLDDFINKKTDLLALIKAQIRVGGKQKHRSDFYMKVIEARLKETGEAYYDLKESSENIKEFCSKLNK